MSPLTSRCFGCVAYVVRASLLRIRATSPCVYPLDRFVVYVSPAVISITPSMEDNERSALLRSCLANAPSRQRRRTIWSRWLSSWIERMAERTNNRINEKKRNDRTKR